MSDGTPEVQAVTTHLVRAWPLPQPGEHKEARGVTLVVGGSRSVPGACILSGESSLRVGAGKLQVATAESVAGSVSLALPEALVHGFPEVEGGDVSADAGEEIADMASSVSSVLLGPGLMNPADAAALVGAVVPHLEGPIVVDALGSAFVTEHREGLRHLDGRCVLTVNPSEAAKILDVDDDRVKDDLRGAASRLASDTGAVVLLGAEQKWICAPDGDTWVVNEGGPGLGVSGSGDVQAGLVTGLLARGAEPAQAAVWGAFLHARAGDRLSASIGRIGFLARELPPVVPALLTELEA